MLEDIRRGIVDCVVVKDLSRFGREYIDSGSISRDYSRLLVCVLLLSMIIMTVLRERIKAYEIIIPFKNSFYHAYCRGYFLLYSGVDSLD